MEVNKNSDINTEKKIRSEIELDKLYNQNYLFNSSRNIEIKSNIKNIPKFTKSSDITKVTKLLSLKEKEKLTIDHIIPLSKGGKTIWSNVVTACYHCNSVIKKDKKLEETGLTLIKKPEIPDFLRMIIYDAKHPLHREKYSCWGNFISEVYWNIELEE